MKPEDLIDAIGRADDNLIEETEKCRENPLKEPIGWKRKLIRWILAACVLAGIVILIVRPWKDDTNLSGGNGCVYLDYYGPVFPLSAAEENKNILVSRRINYDFSCYERKTSVFSEQSEPFASVTDSYLLKNSSVEEQTVTLCYPFNAAMLWKAPSFMLNGAAVQPEWRFGEDLTVSNMLAWDMLDSESWLFYEKTLNLEYGSITAQAEQDMDLPVTVYKIDDVWTEQKEDKDSVKSGHVICFAYPEPDPEKTIVLTCDYTFSIEKTEGMVNCGFFVYLKNIYRTDHLIIVIGEDIGRYEFKAYKNSQMKEEIDSGATVTRYETTLGEVLKKTAQDYWSDMAEEKMENTSLSAEETLYAQIPSETLLRRVVCRLRENGLLSYGTDRPSLPGSLETLYSDILRTERILFAEYKVTVPAGGSLTFSAALEKKGSSIRDRAEKTVNYADICRGYDMLTKSGSLLQFEGQTASISHFDAITITDQNFGFDIEKGTTEVPLDPSAEYYYMNVEKKK